MAIDGIGGPVLRPELNGADKAAARESGNRETGGDFSDSLLSALARARQSEGAAGDLAKRFAAGDQTVGIHEVMIASEKAGIELRYAMTLKNKIIEAYRDLMNTTV